jgi:hypothetical protein
MPFMTSTCRISVHSKQVVLAFISSKYTMPVTKALLEVGIYGVDTDSNLLLQVFFGTIGALKSSSINRHLPTLLRQQLATP